MKRKLDLRNSERKVASEEYRVEEARELRRGAGPKYQIPN